MNYEARLKIQYLMSQGYTLLGISESINLCSARVTAILDNSLVHIKPTAVVRLNKLFMNVCAEKKMEELRK